MMTRPSRELRALTRIAYTVWAFAGLAVAALFLPISDARGIDDSTSRHSEGLRSDTPDTFALTGARVWVDPQTVLDPATLLIADGKIVAVGSDIEIPASARVLDVTGQTIMAAPIDAYAPVAVASDPADNASFWNAQIRPERRTVVGYRSDAEAEKAWRDQGFAARLFAPEDGIIRGQGALISLSEQPIEERVLKADATQHALLTLAGRGEEGAYPGSPMGAVALARQAMYDAQWYAQATRVAETDSSVTRPEFNRSLQALLPVIDRAVPLVVEAPNEAFVLRADRFAREFNVGLVVVGSGEEYQRLAEVGATERTLILPLDFPAPPDVASVERAADVSLETLMHWDLAPENPARCAEAGIKFALTGYGLEEPAKFWPQLRKAIERGLPAATAHAAFTTIPAELLGVSDQVGTLEAGKLANFVVCSKAPWEEGAKIYETWISGIRYEISKPEKELLAGRWELRFEPRLRRSIIVLSGTDKEVKGEWELPAPRRREAQASEGEGEEAEASDEEAAAPEPVKFRQVAYSNWRLSALVPGQAINQEGTLQLNLMLEPTAPETATGTLVDAEGNRYQVTARRLPAEKPEEAEAETATETEGESAESSAEEESSTSETDAAEMPQAEEANEPLKALFEVNYPLGDYGLASAPEQPAAVLFTNVTVWTSGPQGIIENGQVLVRDGLIAEVGTELEVPEDAIVIDGEGTMHLTPGIIDCHSHMGTDSGVNESGQAITAEVRIGDFVDAEDITIYRQLAGGVTSSNILHGSANPIGGQNQVIKLRWGATGEEMKFAEAPQGIKFALGENVKQANWGERFTTRYPQTRMGVEQIIRDEFLAARQYRDRWLTWESERRGLPPRRDLELDAIVEILEGNRWIHCHSYRQDEIIALIHTLDEFQVQIGTLQHILEGYKVAEVLREHGAMASAFSDWWAYKVEVQDAIPYAGAMMHDQGIVVSFNSDDPEMARRLNQEAAKAVKYGGVSPEEALKFVTINPAMQLRIDQYVGSIEPGKHADLVLWSGSPLSNLSRCEQTWIDGRRYFDRGADLEAREQFASMRTQLIQRVLASGEKPSSRSSRRPDTSRMWPRHDEFCVAHDSNRCLDCIWRRAQIESQQNNSAQAQEEQTRSE